VVAIPEIKEAVLRLPPVLYLYILLREMMERTTFRSLLVIFSHPPL